MFEGEIYLNGHFISEVFGRQLSLLMSKGEFYFNWQRGIGSWLFTLDHKRIEFLYMISFFLMAGIFALLMRLEPFKVGESIRNTSFYNKIRAIMFFGDRENQPDRNPYEELSLVEIGEKNFKSHCSACHKTTNQRLVGPSLKGIYNTLRALQNGKSVKADENYIRESILNPGAKIVQGYGNQMPSYKALLSEKELSGLVEYIKTLK